MKDPEKVFEEMASTFAERRAVYKDNWLKIGDVLAALYPNGIHLAGADAFNRFQLFVHFVTRMTRLAESDLTHVDSSLDLAVYAAMLTAFNSPAKGTVSFGIRTKLPTVTMYGRPMIDGKMCECIKQDGKRINVLIGDPPPQVKACPTCEGGLFR